jgi:hypothetical protein
VELLDSLEIRWFLTENTDDLRDWFKAAAREGDRVDHYLMTERDDVGLKVRLVGEQPAKLETKYRLGSLGAVQIAQNVIGTIERWRKVSTRAEGDTALLQTDTWLSVHKDRRLRKLVVENGISREVPASARPDVGCAFELVELRHHRTRDRDSAIAYTVGFEAFGPTANLLDILLTACRAAFSETPNLALDARDSMGYPAWVQTLGTPCG